PPSVVLSPWSDLMVAYAQARRVHKNETFNDALQRSYDLWHEHLESSFMGTVPADLTGMHLYNLNAEARAGALLAGLSWFVRRTATSGLSTLDLLKSLRDDIRDAVLNGKADDQQLVFGTCKDLCVLSSQTLRSQFANSVGLFLDAPENASKIVSAAMDDTL